MTLTDTRPLPPVPTFPFSMFDPVHLGRDEYGQHVLVNLAERNMLLGGEPGAGRSPATTASTSTSSSSTSTPTSPPPSAPSRTGRSSPR